MPWAKAAEKGHLCACGLNGYRVVVVNFPWYLRKHCLNNITWLKIEHTVLLKHFDLQI